MSKRVKSEELGARERQIMDVIYSLGEASVGDVHQRLADPPSYSAVRTMIRLLESKGLLRHRSEGNKYIYRPTQSRETASRRALRHVMATFFGGSAPDTVAALFENEQLTKDDLRRIEAIIAAAKKEGK
ncbi:MAG: BlaI/MecI/CopY family transcriptional regulator [Pirellulaceae bacterium]|nr:BlaI/MecI/CopY family transcriptional regulator [Pirellulaceae bacterium]